MNVYAHAPSTFTARAQELGETFAVSASLAVQHAQIFEQTIRLADQLHAGLNNRALIDQAIGVFRFQYRETVGQALARLRELGGEMQVSVTQIAITVVNDASRRSRDRQTDRCAECNGRRRGLPWTSRIH